MFQSKQHISDTYQSKTRRSMTHKETSIMFVVAVTLAVAVD